MSTDLLVVTSEQRDLVRKTIAPDATDSELELFFYDNKRRGVHPLDKLIHFTKRKGRYVPVTSIHFMRAKADEGGRAGQDQPAFAGQEGLPNYECAVTVYKMVGGEKVPYIGVAKWKEYAPSEANEAFMWRKMPSHMLAKCAEANALRLAFPRELAGLHVQEEVHVLDEHQPIERGIEPQAITSLKDKLKAKLEPVEHDGASTAHQGLGERATAISAHGTHQQSSDDAPPEDNELVLDLTGQIFAAPNGILVNAILQEAAKQQIEGHLNKQEFKHIQSAADERRKQLKVTK